MIDFQRVSVIVDTATLAVPSICFGLCPVLCLQVLLQGDSARPGALSGRVFAVSTSGSLCGGLAGAFIGVQNLGIGTTLICLAAILAVLAALLQVNRCVLAAGPVLLGLAFNSGGAPSRAGMSLIESRESPWQTVQVLRSGAWTVMAFGPENQTVWHPENRQGAPYLAVLTELARVHRVHEALIIGGAGNALGHMLEDLGIGVTVLELDPVVAEMAGRYFGLLKGRVLLGDGRITLRRHGIEPVDLLVLDAFCGPGMIPPHLLTLEAIEEYAARLRAGGILAINMHGAPAGESSRGVRVVCDTVGSVFETTRIWPIVETTNQSTEWQNIWVLASSVVDFSDGLPAVEGSGVPATDDLNPLEVMLPNLSMRAFAGQPLDSIWQLGS
ncbi:MAG: fused MFS/spermidine synthase [Candidatus Thermoplasmatota archaeon]